jgi:hypothetical protein
MTREEWLQQLKVGDTVMVWIGQDCKGPHLVTGSTPTLIQIGKYVRAQRYRRKDGKLAGKRPMGHMFSIEMPK